MTALLVPWIGLMLAQHHPPQPQCCPVAANGSRNCSAANGSRRSDATRMVRRCCPCLHSSQLTWGSATRRVNRSTRCTAGWRASALAYSTTYLTWRERGAGWSEKLCRHSISLGAPANTAWSPPVLPSKPPENMQTPSGTITHHQAPHHPVTQPLDFLLTWPPVSGSLPSSMRWPRTRPCMLISTQYSLGTRPSPSAASTCAGGAGGATP